MTKFRKGRKRQLSQVLLQVALAAACSAFCLSTVAAQNGREDYRSDYRELLVLAGIMERPSINYSVSSIPWGPEPHTGHPWAREEDSSEKPKVDLRLELLGPELFTSWNAARPRGTNDGLLWQGRGANALLSGGIELDWDWLRLRARPELAYSQNLDFPTLPSIEPNWVDGASPPPYAYFWSYIDSPQRFGDQAIFSWGWGDSSIRTILPELHVCASALQLPLTIGFGTEALRIGPAVQNPIIHSDNAPSYPRLDVGLARTPTSIGDVELFTFWGCLEESEGYDTVASNDYRLLTGLSASWAPAPGLSLGFHRSMLSRWEDRDYSSILTLLWPFMELSAGKDARDQRASLSLDWVLPESGFELYAELAKTDYSPYLDFLIRYPFHSLAWTAGARKLYKLQGDRLWGLLEFEACDLGSSRDYQFISKTSFYAHGIITQGYTHLGQWLGAGIGTGSNAQTLTWSFYFPGGRASAWVSRLARDVDYVWWGYAGESPAAERSDEYCFNAEIAAGMSWLSLDLGGICLEIGGEFAINHNPLYNPKSSHSSILIDGGFYLIVSPTAKEWKGVR